MTLYRRNGGAPAPLPWLAFDANGDAWTDLANNPDILATLGFEEAPAQPEYDPATERVVWDADAGQWAVEELPPPPPPPPPRPVMHAMATLNIADADIASVEDAAGLDTAMRIDTGLFWLFFGEELPNNQYQVLHGIMATSERVARTTHKDPAYVEVAVTDLTGAPADPEQLSLTVNRIQ